MQLDMDKSIGKIQTVTMNDLIFVLMYLVQKYSHSAGTHLSVETIIFLYTSSKISKLNYNTLANKLADMHRVASGTTMQWKSRCHLFILCFDHP